jgi:hypothetical protein
VTVPSKSIALLELNPLIVGEADATADRVRTAPVPIAIWPSPLRLPSSAKPFDPLVEATMIVPLSTMLGAKNWPLSVTDTPPSIVILPAAALPAMPTSNEDVLSKYK